MYLPRQDFEWFLQYDGVAAGRRSRRSARCSRPPSLERCFGIRTRSPRREVRRRHVAYPERELRTLDAAMASRVFGPLGMKATTFDFKRALAANRLAALAGRGRQAGARRDGNQLRHHPRAAGRRRLEQRARHAQVCADGASMEDCCQTGGVTSRGIRYSRAGISKSRWVRMRSTAWACSVDSTARWCTTAVT